MTETLGTVVAPSGVVLVYDFGHLGWWNASGKTSRGEPCVDLVLEGADAARAAAYWGAPTLRIHDVPSTGAESSIAAIGAKLRSAGYDVALRAVPTLTPRARVDLALETQRSAGVIFGGLDGCVVRGIPNGPHAVVGERQPDGRWARISLVCGEEPVVVSEKSGHVGVDWARLGFVDPHALDGWRHDEATDGLADFVFWGRDAPEAAVAHSAQAIDARTFGWIDRTVDEVAALGSAVTRWKSAHDKKMATDFRPHSDHYRLMCDVRASSTESGTIRVRDSTMCGFMTSWGDGGFPVWCDYDALSRLVRVRIELAPPT